MKNPQKLFPMIVTDKLAETKKFYTELAGFEVLIEMEGYLAVRSGGDEKDPEIAFISPQTTPEGDELKQFDGRGMVISVPTANADDKAKSLRKAGLEGISDPTDKPWGWRSFTAPDPNGVVLDFFHVVGPNPMLSQA